MILVVYNLVRRFERLREQSTREITEARELFEVALGGIGDAVIVTDAEGRLAYCNDGCRSTLQVRNEDIGRPLVELIASIADGTTSLHESIVERAIAEGGIRRTAMETEIRLRDGSRIHIDATAARIPGQDGKSRGVVLVLRDVSDRRTRAVELSRSNERFRSLVLATSQIVWTTDSTGTVRDDSPSWREYTGQTYEQWKGLGWLDVLHVDDRERTLLGWRTAIEEQRPFIGEYRLRKADGSYCWNMVRAVPVKDPDGTIREWVGMNHDIEVRKRSEQDQRDANRRKDEFIALLAHELRNPLAPLRNGIEILKSGTEDAGPRALAMMDRQVQHMVRLIDDLLDVSRIGQGKLELRRERIDLCQVVREAVAATDSSIEAKHQHLRVSLPQTPLWVDGDPVRLNQIVANLLNNAVKYSGDGADIWVTAEREGTRHFVSVRDSGQGIATELRPRIWDLFLQGPGHIERSEGGLGIGLTLVKQLVELHDGTVEVQSEGVGTGSEFIVRLPVAAAPLAAESGSTTSAPARARIPALRVLVIDDNEDSADSTAMLLRLSGHTVRTETRGEAGLVEFARFAPELVLCDIRMPDLSGYEVARRIRVLPGGDRVMLAALTGFGTQLDREESSRAGFDRHFVKPVDPDALTDLLGEAAERAAARPPADRGD
jgi:two-component system CheB/CheR fusion protein